MYINVLVTKPFDQYFTYKYTSKQTIKRGSVVLVPFGKTKNQLGLVYESFAKLPREDKKIHIKKIISVFENIYISEKLIQFIDWIANYTLAPKGLVLKLFLLNKKIIEYLYIDDKKNILQTLKVNLNLEQKKACDVLSVLMVSKFQPVVLEGVTGSGKTEVYFEAVEKILQQNKQVLIMLPEISLTPQFEDRFKTRFGFLPTVWHSKVTEKNRKKYLALLLSRKISSSYRS